MQSYEYENRQGVAPVSWAQFTALCQDIAEGLSREGVQAVVGIARPGLFPATQIALQLRTELFPVRVTRRVQDVPVYDHPIWKVPVSPEVAGKVVAVIDEIADTGESLALVAEAVRQAGATRVVTATLASHTWAQPRPDLCPLVTDALVLWPWDQRAWVDGRWQPHPESVAAASSQGITLPTGWAESQEIYLVRHCTAAGQAAEAPLTPAGQQQAELLAERLAGTGITRIIASPMQRAQATVAPLAQRLGLEVQVEPRLSERVLATGDLPDWRTHLEASFVDLDRRLPGGESSRDAMARAVAVLQEALAHGAQRTLLCSHGNLLALLLHHFDPKFGFAGWQSLTNPDVYRITFDPVRGPQIERLWESYAQ